MQNYPATRQRESRVDNTLSLLASRGWISLKAMAPLLGYAHTTGIYQRQKGKHPITTIKVGGQYRVYAEEFVEALLNVPARDREAADILLIRYRRLVKEKEQESA